MLGLVKFLERFSVESFFERWDIVIDRGCGKSWESKGGELVGRESVDLHDNLEGERKVEEKVF
jgi:hypothetical protein